MRDADRDAALRTARRGKHKDAPRSALGDRMPRTLAIPIAVTLALLLGACDKCTDLLSPFKRASGPAACSGSAPQPR